MLKNPQVIQGPYPLLFAFSRSGVELRYANVCEIAPGDGCKWTYILQWNTGVDILQWNTGVDTLILQGL